jgi:hypothetical protein
MAAHWLLVLRVATGTPCKMLLMPNPGKGDFVLDLVWDKEEQLAITIINQAGIKVKEFIVARNGNTKHSIAFAINEPPGIYI